MDRCPNCRARRETGETCRRCGMDLRLLLALEQGVEGLIRRALGQLAGGDPAAAVRTLTGAQTLHPEPLVAPLLGFARHLADAAP